MQESLDILLRDMKLANRLGFKIMRPKLGVITDDLVPDPVWREMVERALPYAEELDVKIAPEIHSPTPLKSKTVDDYMDLIAKTGTKHFGMLIDTGIFKTREGRTLAPGEWADPILAVDPRDLIPFLPYVFHMHAKFWNVSRRSRRREHPLRPGRRGAERGRLHRLPLRGVRGTARVLRWQ